MRATNITVQIYHFNILPFCLFPLYIVMQAIPKLLTLGKA